MASFLALLVGCGGGSHSPPVTYSIGAKVSGLSGSGLILQLSAGGTLAVTADGTSTFAMPLPGGTAYQLSVKTQPSSPRQICSVTSGSGVVAASNVTVAITCQTVLTTLYSFGPLQSSDGASPTALVQGHDGNLYGVTKTGGSFGLGTLFKITLAGQEVVVYSFGCAPGCVISVFSPTNLIVGSDGNFYGKTPGPEGSRVTGIVWGVTPNGVGVLLRAFGGQPDELAFAEPSGVIQASDGLLYGTVYLPGVTSPGCFFEYEECVFALSIAGVGGVVGDGFGANCYAGCPAGSRPAASLVQTRDGYLYGTATAGGAFGNGTVFRTSPGTSQVIPVVAIYSFGAPGDPVHPEFSLVEGADGNLYGTSSQGGSPSALCPQGCGTVFKVTPAGIETVLHSFGGSGTDGQSPSGSLLLGSDGNFYGVTLHGGSGADCQVANGCGTVYRITPSGVETVLYSFGTTASDGIGPSGALLQASDGNLYGTTVDGGTAGFTAGTGTVFRLDLLAN